jgi:hypothetical protein
MAQMDITCLLNHVLRRICHFYGLPPVMHNLNLITNSRRKHKLKDAPKNNLPKLFKNVRKQRKTKDYIRKKREQNDM